MTDEPQDVTERADSAGASDAAPKPKLSKAERLEAKAARLREAQERRAAEEAGGAAPRAPRHLITAVVVLSTLCFALIALLIPLYVAWQDERDANAVRSKAPLALDKGYARSAVQAAKSFAIDFGSYDYRHLDTEFAAVARRMTPGFAKSYVETSDKLKPTFRQYKTQVTAQIQGFGVTSASPSAATVVIFLDQTVRTSQSKTPRIDRNRLEIHLVYEKGDWLVQKLLAK